MGPKRWNYFLPVFKAPKNSVKMVVFFDLWLSLRFTHLLLSQSVQWQKNLVLSFFCCPFFWSSSTNIHQQPSQQKIEKGMANIPFPKSLLWTKPPESDENLEPLSESFGDKNPLKSRFLKWFQMWATYWPGNVDHLLTLKTPKCGPLIDRTIFIYIYICVCVCVCAHFAVWSSHLFCLLGGFERFGLKRGNHLA